MDQHYSNIRVQKKESSTSGEQYTSPRMSSSDKQSSKDKALLNNKVNVENKTMSKDEIEVELEAQRAMFSDKTKNFLRSQ